MKFLTTAAILSLAVAQGVYAVDFDFRDFEGLWESNEVEVVRFDLDFTDLPPDIVPLAQPLTQGQLVGVQSLGSIQCQATGDFRKAMCDFTFRQPLPICPNAVIGAKFILDQFDASTGKTKVLKARGRCCDAATSNCFDLPTPNIQLTLLAGKSNKHVRAMSVTFGAPDLANPDDDKPFEQAEANFQMRKTGGGFKSYD